MIKCVKHFITSLLSKGKSFMVCFFILPSPLRLMVLKPYLDKPEKWPQRHKVTKQKLFDTNRLDVFQPGTLNPEPLNLSLCLGGENILLLKKNSVGHLPLSAIHDFGVSADKAYRVLFGGVTALAMNKPPMIQATDSRTLNSAPNPAATPLACKVPSAL